MTMRASRRRNITANDDYGAPGAPSSTWEIVESIPCLVYVNAKREFEAGVKVGVVEEIKGIFRFDADIERGDQIYELKDRRSRTVLDGILDVDAVTPRTIEDCPSHREAILRRHHG